MSAELDSHTRSIRNIQIVRQDLFPLVAESNKDKRIPSATINAFGASIQDLFDSSNEGADFCIFSSWLAVLVDGKVSEKDEKNVGAFSDHVMQACPSGTKEDILARTRWAIPLCSGSPPHWVLGSVDFTRNKLEIFDSIPELASSTWAKPLLRLTVNKIRQSIDTTLVNWNQAKWTSCTWSPSESERQTDNWACGLFVMMALRAFAWNAANRDLVANSMRDRMRKECLDVLLALPISRLAGRAHTNASDYPAEYHLLDRKPMDWQEEGPLDNAASRQVKDMTDSILLPVSEMQEAPSTAQKLLVIQASKSSFMPSLSPANPSLSITLTPSLACPKVASPQSVAYPMIPATETMVSVQGASTITRAATASSMGVEAVEVKMKTLKRSHETDPADEADGQGLEGYTTDTEVDSSRQSKVASEKREAKKNITQRRSKLENDEWVKSGTTRPNQLTCKGCNKLVRLHSKRQYDDANWQVHKTRCPNITGVAKKRKRVLDTKTLKTTPGSLGTIASFFVARQKQKSDPLPSASNDHQSKVSGPEMPLGLIEIAERAEYTTHTFKATPSIAHIFGPPTKDKSAFPARKIVEEQRVLCQHLHELKHQEYAHRTQTRSLGGVSLEERARVNRQLFPYKPFPPLNSRSKWKENQQGDEDVEMADASRSSVASVKVEVPAEGNREIPIGAWTDKERRQHDAHLKAISRWQVDYVTGSVQSTRCTGTTANESKVCDACQELGDDESFKRAVRKKAYEALLPEDKQRQLHVAREKFAPSTFRDVDGRELQKKLGDPLLFGVYTKLERGESTAAFLQLYKFAKEGKLKCYDTFADVCKVMADRIKHETDKNKKAKFGIRYPVNYLNFFTLLRSYGGESARQYGIITSALGGPSPRHLRTLVATSTDSLQNPSLIYENIARVKRYVDSISYKGPVCVGGDCTKVRSRLTYSNDYGSHIIGSTLSLDVCEVNGCEDIDTIIENVKGQRAMATQVRAILIKVPLPQHPPLVVAILPTNGKDDAQSIHAQHMELRKMASECGLPVISFAADGAASELSSQCLMDNEASECPPLVYKNEVYGFDLKAPVFRVTGPIVSVSDPPHGRKTCRNQPQHGTHTATLGNGYIVNRSLLLLYKTGKAGLVLRDVQDVDKQDDGAARRLFHHSALSATTEERDGHLSIKEEHTGLFAYLYFFGELFDAWLSRKLAVSDRVVAAARARMFLHIWWKHVSALSAQFPDLFSTKRSFISPASFNIFNRMCDSLLLLVLAYAKHYPDQPFCPWLMGTEFVEHFFGLARQLLPNFTFAEVLKLIKHLMVRQRILLSGKFGEKRERNSRSGYSFDFDSSPLSPEDLLRSRVTLTTHDINRLIEIGCKDAIQICKTILCMPIPTLPLALAPLGAVGRKKVQPERSAGAGSTSEEEDSDEEVEEDGDDDIEDPAVDTFGNDLDLASTTAAAALDAHRYSGICEEHDTAVAELHEVEKLASPLLPNTQPSPSHPTIDHVIGITEFKSTILDSIGKLSISKMLEARAQHQSSTTTRSERVVKLSPKFTILAENTSNEPGEEMPKMSIQEASHRVRIVQELDSHVNAKKPRKSRELRWREIAKHIARLVSPTELPNVVGKNVTMLCPLRPDCFAIMRTPKRFYIGEILDLYKKGNSSRYGSIESTDNVSQLAWLSLRVYLPLEISADDDDDESNDDNDGLPLTAPPFSSRYKKKCEMHTHASINDLLYNLGFVAFTGKDPNNQVLTPLCTSRWLSFQKPAVRKVVKLTIKLPGQKKQG